MVHKKKSTFFYKRLREPSDDEVIFSMDCEKSQPLPKMSIGPAYFSRQINMANFTIVSGGARTSLTPNNVVSFVWSEIIAKKGVNDIASCIYHTLKSHKYDPKISKIVCAMDNT